MREERSDDRVRVFAPDHCPVTVIEVTGGRIRLIVRGAETDSRVL